ncbi:MAG: hypothetical protein HOV83_24760, partial [Catenulispora sp.]|nr:hypothetical protein [Catenulispora sp.]
MFEAWEAEAGRSDLDLAALRAKGIQIHGTNERHPNVDVFSYLGLMAVKLLLDAGVPAYRSRIAVLCDNPFHDYLVRGLEGAGATVTSAASLAELLDQDTPDALLVSQKPRGGSVLSASEIERLASGWPGVLVAQYWGDLDRAELARYDLPVWPATARSTGP